MKQPTQKQNSKIERDCELRVSLFHYYKLTPHARKFNKIIIDTEKI